MNAALPSGLPTAPGHLFGSPFRLEIAQRFNAGVWPSTLGIVPSGTKEASNPIDRREPERVSFVPAGT